jgi:diguanylate cyclase (GGDEF)-like protein/PAS domain S-box-containing protein
MSEQDVNKDRLALALEAAGLDLWENDLVTGDVTRRATKTFAELGYTEEESLPYLDDLFKIVHADDIARVKTAINDHFAGVTPQYRCEFRLRAKSGAWVWYANYGKIMDRDGGNSGRRFIGATFNIDDRKRQEEELTIREQEWRTLTENSPDTIARYDKDCRRIYVNPAFGAMIDGGVAALLGKKPSEFPGGPDSAVYEAKVEDVFVTGESAQFELIWPGKDGKENCSHIRLTSEHDSSGKVISVLGVGRDITELNTFRAELKQANVQLESMNSQLQSLATRDPLTHLPNRRLMLDRLQQALASIARSGRAGSLLFVDLDHFKTLNDTLGHDIGDMLLKQVTQRLESCIREGDTVARMGGDEFLVMLLDLSAQPIEAAAQTESIGEKILAALDQPYHLGSYVHRCTASIGATLLKAHQQRAEEFIKQADIAMYQAKKSGRNALCFFDPKMQVAITNRATLGNELHKAIDSRQFQMHYQIQVDSALRPVGAEALIRWIHPERGLMFPDEFISLAEETGLIVAIGHWVLETACAQIKAWEQEPLTRDLVLAVNVSAKQFHRGDFVAQLKDIVQRHAINPTRLKLELTESLLLENIEGIIVTMNALNEIGIQFSLDDFGTGFSSLQYLKQLPLHQLKIDQSFVRDIAADSNDKAIVSTIIAMAHSLDLDVIAEGVETEEQLQFLVNRNCTHYQGHLFGSPIPIERFEALLKSRAECL